MVGEPVSPVLEACETALRYFEGEDLVEVSRRVGAHYSTKGIDELFADGPAFAKVLRAGQPNAIGCLIAILIEAHLAPLAREIAYAVVRAPDWHDDEMLVLESRRFLVTIDDEPASASTSAREATTRSSSRRHLSELEPPLREQLVPTFAT